MRKATASQRLQSTLMMLVVCFIVVFSASNVSSAEFDNHVGVYDEVTEEVEIYNCMIGTEGLCLIEGSAIGKAKLLTPKHNLVPVNNKEVPAHIFELSAYDNYADALKTPVFENINDKRTKINKDFDYKMLSYKDEIIEDYYMDCSNAYYENNVKLGCERIENGTHIEQKEVWKKVTPADLMKNEMVTIGVFVDVKKGDIVDWIPQIFGAKIPQWAVIEASTISGMTAYYKMDESSGTLVNSIKEGTYDLTGASITYGETGILNDAISLTGLSGSYAIGDSGIIGDTTVSASAWFKTSDVSGSLMPIITLNAGGVFDEGVLVAIKNSGVGKLSILIQGVAWGTDSTGTYNDGNWHNVVLTRSGTSYNVYVDGGSSPVSTLSNGGGTFTTKNMIGARKTAELGFDGIIDETAIWNRVITTSEIAEMYGSGSPPELNDTISSPEVTLTSPADGANLTSQTQEFVAIAIDDIKVDNVTLIYDGVNNYTNTSGVNGTYTFTINNITTGSHDWSILAWNNNSLSTQSANRSFTIHTTAPSVSVTAPSGTLSSIIIGENETLNYNISEVGQNLTLHLDNCWLEYNGVNNSINCSENTTEFLYIDGVNTLNVWANDTFGLESGDTATWGYNLIENNWDYANTSLEGSIDDWELNITMDSSLSPNAVYLVYNGTAILGSINEFATNQYTLTAQSVAPSTVSGTNYTAYFSITLNDTTITNTSSKTQLVTNLGIDDCSSFNNTLFNFTIYDEINQAIVSGAGKNTEGEVNVQLYDISDQSLIVNFYNGYSSENSFAICLDNNLTGSDEFIINLELSYTADDYSKKFYYIAGESLNVDDLNTQIPLYLLDNTTSQAFKIIYKDENFLPVSGVLQLQRKYVSEGVFKTVEQPRIDGNGEAIMQVELEDAVYTINIIIDGAVDAVFDDIRFYCPNPLIDDCEEVLNKFESYSDVTDFNTVNGLSFSFDYNDTTRQVSSPFTVLTGSSKNVGLSVSLYDAFGNQSICSDSLVSSGGTLSCTVPNSFGNASVIAEITDSGETVGKSVIRLDGFGQDNYGVSIVVIGVVSLLLLIMIGLSPGEPILYGLFLIIGVVFLTLLNVIFSTSWIGAGATFLWFIIAIIVIVVKGANR